jgi:hypothetical protein
VAAFALSGSQSRSGVHGEAHHGSHSNRTQAVGLVHALGHNSRMTPWRHHLPRPLLYPLPHPTAMLLVAPLLLYLQLLLARPLVAPRRMPRRPTHRVLSHRASRITLDQLAHLAPTAPKLAGTELPGRSYRAAIAPAPKTHRDMPDARYTSVRFKKNRRQKPAGAPVGAPVELRSARRSAWKGLASGHRISTTFNGQNHLKK